METLTAFMAPFLPYLLAALPFVLGIIALAAQGQLDNFVREVVASVYRVSIHAAEVLQDQGIAWLTSAEGITYRKQLATDAYQHLPDTFGPLPVGLVKVYLTEARFCELVEAAFAEVVKLSHKIALPVGPPLG